MPMDGFRFLTAGESHGPTLGVTVEGVPAGLDLTAEDLVVDLVVVVADFLELFPLDPLGDVHEAKLVQVNS